MPARSFTWSLRDSYLSLVTVAGLSVVCLSLYSTLAEPPDRLWFVLVALTIFSGTFTIRIPGVPAWISVSETFVFTAVLFYGAGPSTLIVALDGLIISLWRNRRRLTRILFNTAEPAIAVWTASHVLFAITGPEPASGSLRTLTFALGLLSFTVVYFALNSTLTAVAIAFQRNTSVISVWRQHFLWLSLNYFAGASIAVLVSYQSSGHLDAVRLLVIVPLLVISYLTFKMTLGRAEDATEHLEALNALYVSTIQTLATAIDAGDQVTHRHVRRVQRAAVRLARELQVTDEPTLRALDAAALLHDIGKLAVPDYILNKPGKLDSIELARMKKHAALGAEILSAIEFPYPVVPIVRHHHENWDGTGYPDGLVGTEIPLAARILAVVDCYDALLSHRPYRPAMKHEDALAILQERRGTMYDPMVIDAFMNAAPELLDGFESDPAPQTEVNEPSFSTPPTPIVWPHDTSPHNAMLAVYDLCASTDVPIRLHDLADALCRRVRALVDAEICVLYTRQPEQDALLAAHVNGAESLRHLRIEFGRGPTGWVAANRRSIINAPAVLDLGQLTPKVAGAGLHCLAAPLVSGDVLVGVLSTYAPHVFNDDDRRTLEVVSAKVAKTCSEAIAFESALGSVLRDEVTGLPNRRRFSQLARLIGPTCDGAKASLLLVEVEYPASTTNHRFAQAPDAILRHVANILQAGLRSSDVLFRYDTSAFVAVLEGTSVFDAEMIAGRLRVDFEASNTVLVAGRNAGVSVRVRTAAVAEGAESLVDVVDVALGHSAVNRHAGLAAETVQ